MSREIAQQFMDDFVEPLICGGTIHIRRLVDARHVEAIVERFLHDDDQCERIRLAWHTAIRSIWFGPLPVHFSVDEIRLLLGAYTALALQHPSLSGFRAPKKLGLFTQGCFALKAPTTHRDLLGRHAIVQRLFYVEREDHKVESWLAKYQFVGSPVPPRLLAMPGLRRISHTTQRKVIDSLMPEHLLDALLAASPLTELLSACFPRVSTGHQRASAYLADPTVYRVVAGRYSELPPEQVLPEIASWVMADRRAGTTHVRYSTALFLELVLGRLLAGERLTAELLSDGLKQARALLFEIWQGALSRESLSVEALERLDQLMTEMSEALPSRAGAMQQTRA